MCHNELVINNAKRIGGFVGYIEPEDLYHEDDEIYISEEEMFGDRDVADFYDEEDL